ncbi:MAG: Cof-type HAD-IIB family hydrolase [Chloroflexota bacterium]
MVDSRHIKLIAIDLDGTLLDSNHEIRPRTLKSLKQLLAQGIQILIATGKTHFSAVDVKKQLGIQTWGVFSQGLTIQNPQDEIIYEQHLPDEISTRAVNLLNNADVPFVIYRNDGLYNIQESAFDQFLIEHHEPRPQVQHSKENLLQHLPFQKVLINGPQDFLQEFKQQLIGEFGESAHFVFSVETVLEVVPAGSSKGNGVAKAIELLGFTADEVMAFGDGDNDIEMLAMMGVGVAMGNGTSAAKAAADYVTLANDDDGIVHALYHFGILNEAKETL